MMKIGIIVHSHTGNTLSVAREIKDSLLVVGHSVTLEQVAASNDEQTDASKVQLISIPDVSGYDVLILGAPVRGMSLSAVMAAYLQRVSLQGRKVGCFVTQKFPYPWMGGNRAIEQFKTACTSKGAQVSATAIVNWSSGKRMKMIKEAVEKMSKLP